MLDLLEHFRAFTRHRSGLELRQRELSYVENEGFGPPRKEMYGRVLEAAIYRKMFLTPYMT